MNEAINSNSESFGEQNSEENAWQKMANEMPSFEERDILETTTNEKTDADKNKVSNKNYERERELDRESKKIFNDLLKSEAINPIKDYAKLTEFANLRAKALGANIPINIFLRVEFWQDNRRRQLRMNPETREPFSGYWCWSDRAFHVPGEGTYLDFPAQSDAEGTKPLEQQNKTGLSGYEAADALIDFAYTCEHELRHDLQNQRLAQKEVSYNTLRLAKDDILLTTIHNFSGDSAEYFYHNAHDQFFLEADANSAADSLFDKLLPIDGTLANKIANPNDPPEFQHTIYSILEKRQKQYVSKDKDFSLALGQNKIGMPEKTYHGTAEEIVSEYCDDIVRLYPSLIKEYPALSLEYNDDGTPKSLDDIENVIHQVNQEHKTIIGGQELTPQQTKNYYHKIMRNSKRLQNGKKLREYREQFKKTIHRQSGSGKNGSEGSTGEFEQQEEQIPADKTPEQIEIEKAKRKQKADAEFWQRIQGYKEQQNNARKNREENERKIAEQEQAEAERRQRIKEAQEKVRQTYRRQEQKTEEESEDEEMGMGM